MRMECKYLAANEYETVLWHTIERSTIELERELFSGTSIDPIVHIAIEYDDTENTSDISIGINASDDILQKYKGFDRADIIIEFISNEPTYLRVYDMRISYYDHKKKFTGDVINDLQYASSIVNNFEYPIVLETDDDTESENSINFLLNMRRIFLESRYTLDITEEPDMQFDEMGPHTNIYILFKK